MADDPTGVGRWRQVGSTGRSEPRGPTSTWKWTGTTVVSALLAASLGVIGWLVFQLWFAPGPRPYFVSFWVGPYDRPEIPPTAWLDADRRALLDDRVFPDADSGTEFDDASTLEVMRKRLEQLAGRRNDEAVVVYLSAYAIVDQHKKIQIMAADSKPYEAKTQLPLAWALDRLKACRVKNKLLVLDIMRGMIDPRDVGGTADGVGDLIAQELQDSADPGRLNDPDLMVIAACGPGQIALGAETIRHSVFGFFFHRALTTDEADDDRDGTVSVRELAGYLGANVDDWAMHHRGLHQKPTLLGRPQGDFRLAATRLARAAAAVSPAETVDEPRAKKSDRIAGSDSKTKEELAGQQKDAAKAEEAIADAGKTQPGVEKEHAYPAWLGRSWAELERWWKTGDFRAAPRVYRRLASELIRADLRWRGGERAELVQRDMEATVLELTAAMKKAKQISRPAERSVGQARDFGWQPDPAMTAALSGLLHRRHELPDGSPDLPKVVNETLAKFKDKPALDLAGALIEASEGETFDAETLAFLERVVEQSRAVLDPSHPPQGVLELQFLSQLVQRARREPRNWKPETARIAWLTLLAAEQANSQPESLAWTRPLLDEADASLHEARVLFLPAAADYASWKQIDAAWSDAHEKYQAVTGRQQAIREGHAALARALAVLVGLIPYLEASPQADLQADWLETAAQCGELARKLAPPLDQQPEDAGALSTLADAHRRLDDSSRKLLAPFQPAAVHAIVERSSSQNPPPPELAGQIDALLLTPFFTVADRLALYDAGRALDARLEKTWRAARPTRLPAAAAGVRSAERVRRRSERMAALLELAGDARTGRLLDEVRQAFELAGLDRSPAGSDPVGDKSDPAIIWAATAHGTELIHTAFERLVRSGNDDRDDFLDRVGWLAPAYVSGFDDWTTNPIRRSLERAARTTWTWLAGHYQYENRDLRGLMDPDDVLELAARECRAVADPGSPEVALRIEGPISPIQLSARRATATVRLHLALTGAGAKGPHEVRLDVLQPDDTRLEVSAPEPAVPEVSPTNLPEVALGIKFSDDPSRAGAPPPGGLVVRAHLPNGRTYHALVPLAVRPAGAVPTLALSRDRTQCDDLPMDPLRLRPIAGWRQAFSVFVKNPSDQPREVIVEVYEGDKLLGSSGAKPLSVAAGASIVVPSFGTPAPKPGVELSELTGPLRLRLHDVAGNLFDEQFLRATIAAPRDYVEVSRVEFVPEAPGQPNRLTVQLRARPELAGPPCPVALVLPTNKDHFPALREPPKAGKLVGELQAGKSELTLYAEKLALGLVDKGFFYLNVDSVDRALWFQCRFPQMGGPQPASAWDQPRVSFRASPQVAPDKPAQLDIAFQVDDAPTDAVLDVRLGQFRGGRIANELAWGGPARRRHLGFDCGGEGGALLFDASIQDQAWNPPVPGMVGPRRLQARLIDASGTELNSYEADVVLDDFMPGAMSVQFPDRIVRGKDLTVRASVTPPPSKVKEVAFIFGPKADFSKAEAENRSFKARTEDPEGRDWTATLPVPKDAPAKLVITARFTTGVGLTGFQSEEAAVIDPPKPEDMKPARGAITGIVREGNITQRELKVYLLDPTAPAGKNQVLATTVTDAQGAFSFKDLEPKPYQIYCIKQDGINNRKALNRVVVEPGKTLTHDLDLVI